MIGEDGSTGQILAVLLAATLIGGLLGAIRAVTLLGQIDDDWDDDDRALADLEPWGSTGANHPSRPWNIP